MKTNFEGRRVFVSGSTAGIGLEIAREFARQGATLAVSGRDQARLVGRLKRPLLYGEHGVALTFSSAMLAADVRCHLERSREMSGNV